MSIEEQMKDISEMLKASLLKMKQLEGEIMESNPKSGENRAEACLFVGMISAWEFTVRAVSDMIDGTAMAIEARNQAKGGNQ